MLTPSEQSLFLPVVADALGVPSVEWVRGGKASVLEAVHALEKAFENIHMPRSGSDDFEHDSGLPSPPAGSLSPQTRPVYTARILRARANWLHNASVDKTIYTPMGDALRAKLVAMRKAGELTQRQLAAKLRREHSFVARLELGERRVDLAEFYQICMACGQDPVKMTRELLREFGRLVAARVKKRERSTL